MPGRGGCCCRREPYLDETVRREDTPAPAATCHTVLPLTAGPSTRGTTISETGGAAPDKMPPRPLAPAAHHAAVPPRSGWYGVSVTEARDPNIPPIQRSAGEDTCTCSGSRPFASRGAVAEPLGCAPGLLAAAPRNLVARPGLMRRPTGKRARYVLGVSSFHAVRGGPGAFNGAAGVCPRKPLASRPAWQASSLHYLPPPGMAWLPFSQKAGLARERMVAAFPPPP
jgi:hypothetical protein